MIMSIHDAREIINILMEKLRVIGAFSVYKSFESVSFQTPFFFLVQSAK